MSLRVLGGAAVHRQPYVCLFCLTKVSPVRLQPQASFRRGLRIIPRVDTSVVTTLEDAVEAATQKEGSPVPRSDRGRKPSRETAESSQEGQISTSLKDKRSKADDAANDTGDDRLLADADSGPGSTLSAEAAANPKTMRKATSRVAALDKRVKIWENQTHVTTSGLRVKRRRLTRLKTVIEELTRFIEANTRTQPDSVALAKSRSLLERVHSLLANPNVGVPREPSIPSSGAEYDPHTNAGTEFEPTTEGASDQPSQSLDAIRGGDFYGPGDDDSKVGIHEPWKNTYLQHPRNWTVLAKLLGELGGLVGRVERHIRALGLGGDDATMVSPPVGIKSSAGPSTGPVSGIVRRTPGEPKTQPLSTNRVRRVIGSPSLGKDLGEEQPSQNNDPVLGKESTADDRDAIQEPVKPVRLISATQSSRTITRQSTRVIEDIALHVSASTTHGKAQGTQTLFDVSGYTSLETALSNAQKVDAKPQGNATGPEPAEDAAVVMKNHGPASSKNVSNDSSSKKGETKARRKTKVPEKQAVPEMDVDNVELLPLKIKQPPVPALSYGLDRVLFNPGVYQLQDPRSRVFNFDPYLQKIMPVSEFNFDALKDYITSSKDRSLANIAEEHNKRYVGSTSSMTGVLSHFHFLLSKWRELNLNSLSRYFPTLDWYKNFTLLARAPSAIILKHSNGSYSIDADKEFASSNVLSLLGKSMEKLLTLNTEEYERYRKTNPNQVSEEERSVPESYHYTTMGDFLMRSQLDAHDARLPGTGMFDLKTRSVLTVRMDAENYEEARGYELRTLNGEFTSFEREFADMARATLLKYSLQVRMGRMDGIFLAYHNTERIFGFQYLSQNDMDLVLHGQSDPVLGDREFKMSLKLLNEVFDEAIARFPGQSLRIHFETRQMEVPYMYIFVKPVTEAHLAEIDAQNAEKVVALERQIVGADHDFVKDRGNIEASVQQAIEIDKRDSPESDNVPESVAQHLAPNALEEESKVISSSSLTIETPEVSPAADGTDQSALSLSETGFSESTTLAEALAGSSILEKSSNAKAENDITSARPYKASGDSAFLDSLSAEADSSIPRDSTGAPEPILAFTLTTRSRVNGKYVDRPGNLAAPKSLEQEVEMGLKHGDKWTVEYSLKEVGGTDKAWTLYNACQQRRKKRLDPEDDPTDKRANQFYQKMRQLAQEGRDYRQEVDAKDRGRSTMVVADPRPRGNLGEETMRQNEEAASLANEQEAAEAPEEASEVEAEAEKEPEEVSEAEAEAEKAPEEEVLKAMSTEEMSKEDEAEGIFEDDEQDVEEVQARPMEAEDREETLRDDEQDVEEMQARPVEAKGREETLRDDGAEIVYEDDEEDNNKGRRRGRW